MFYEISLYMIDYNKIIITLNNLPNVWQAKIAHFLDLIKNKKIEDDIIWYFNACISIWLIPWLKTEFDNAVLEKAKSEYDRIKDQSDKLWIKITNCFDEDYPKLFNRLNNAPQIIYSKWPIERINKIKNIAIIWTREPTKEWINASEWLWKTFSENWFNIISWLAKWCDSFAHIWALKSDKWITTAILWNWLDTIYPNENIELANNILSKWWILLSEYPVWFTSKNWSLTSRDRLQAWMSDAIIGVQFWEKSWTIHAINTAIKNSIPTYVVKFNNMQSLWDKITWNIKYLKSWEAKEITSTNINDIITNINNI